MILKYSFLLLITLLTLNACKQIQALKCKNIARFEMVSASLKETQINLDLIIENPNANQLGYPIETTDEIAVTGKFIEL